MNKLKKILTGITGRRKSKKASNLNGTDIETPSTHTNITISSVSNVRTVQNFRLVWLDSSIDEVNNTDCINTITQLRHVVNTVKMFTNVDECIKFMTNTEDEKIFMITSGEFGQTTVPIIHDMVQINCIYIFCKHKARHEQWAQEWSKVRGVFTDIIPICEALKQAAQDCDQNSISISFVKKSSDEASHANLDHLDQSFMYTQILKEILLTIDFQQQHINEFLTYCREQFDGNTNELKNVDKIEKEYPHHQPIWWYTYDCFLYSMLNRALRTMEVDLIIKMGFFVRDLYNHIATLHTEQYDGQNQSDSFTVYRGQGLSQTDFDQLKNTQGGLLSFNNFLSTSEKHGVSLEFARRTVATSKLVGVLFVMKIDPSISATPFANVKDVSYYQGEEEILFSMHSVFRINEVKQIDENDRLWQVNLTLTSDKDPQLYALTEIMRQETFSGYKGWYRLGEVLIILGQYYKAQQAYEALLSQTSSDSSIAFIYNRLGCVTDYQGKYEEAITFYGQAVEIYENRCENNQALANSYDNIGGLYDNMGEYAKALSYYEKSLEISQKTLPLDHPDVATSYNNIGLVYFNMGEYSKALSYYEKAFKIFQDTLPANHPDVATSYNNTGLVYDNMGEDSKALTYYEKALEIQEKSLPPNHPDLGTSYNNIGRVYDDMQDYTKALSYFEKALKIDQKTLSANHPNLATSYSNIGNVYNKMNEHMEALSYYEKALEIRQKTLPENHLDLANSYNNIGRVYDDMREYSEALSYFERALDIRKRSLPSDHPHIQNVRRSIESVEKKL